MRSCGVVELDTGQTVAVTPIEGVSPPISFFTGPSRSCKEFGSPAPMNTFAAKRCASWVCRNCSGGVSPCLT